MRIKLFLSILFIIVVFGINFGTSPTIPYHKYFVNGFVLCDSIYDKSNFTIQLFGKSIESLNDYVPISYSYIDFERPLVLTDSTGNFSIVANSYLFFDSIKVTIIHPRGAIIFSNPNFIDKNFAFAIQGQGEDINTTGGCSSCTDEPMSANYIIRYEHNLSANINYCE